MKKLISFIILIVSFQSAFSQELNKGMEILAWNFIRAKFMGERKQPIIYRNDIAIRLEGNYTSVDSMEIAEMLNQIKMIIPNRKIFLTSANENLILKFTDFRFGAGNMIKGKTSGRFILFRSIEVSFPSKEITAEERKKVLYYCLFRSLVEFSPLPTQIVPRGPGVYLESSDDDPKIPHCVFSERKPEEITFSSYDQLILKNLYAPDFKDQFKKYYTSTYSYRGYLIAMYSKELKLSFFIVDFLLIMTILSTSIIKGFFNAHNWNWLKFNKQGLILIICGGIYLIGYFLSNDLALNSSEILVIFNYFIIAILAVNAIFFIEKLIIKNNDGGGSKIIIVFITTLFVLMIFSVVFSISVQISAQLVLFSKITVNAAFADSFSTYFNDFNFNDFYKYFGPFLLTPSLGRSFFIFFNDKYKSIIYEKDVELARINEMHKQAELQSLQAKINPHFLYNALNSIASLASTDSKKTEQMALSLSDFFKYAINREQKQFNSLSEELNAIRTYLEIEKVRYGDRLNFEIDCAEELLNVQIPQLLIQPLVENAIKHGLSKILEKGLVRISVSREEKQLKIRIYDNGPAFPEGLLSGYGIQNTQERITLLYGGKASINWHNRDEKYIEISLPEEQLTVK
jgi:two-component system, LytTR family, sensor kinase